MQKYAKQQDKGKRGREQDSVIVDRKIKRIGMHENKEEIRKMVVESKKEGREHERTKKRGKRNGRERKGRNERR